MNAGVISDALLPRCRDKFLGVYASDRLPCVLPRRRPLLMVANTDPHDKPGEHWVAMYFGRDGKGEYFDSLAQRPVKSIFKRYMNKNCSSWKTIGRQIQSIISFYCGHYATYYCLYRSLGYSMEELLRPFAHDTSLNDVLVHSIICHQLEIN